MQIKLRNIGMLKEAELSQNSKSFLYNQNSKNQGV